MSENPDLPQYEGEMPRNFNESVYAAVGTDIAINFLREHLSAFADINLSDTKVGKYKSWQVSTVDVRSFSVDFKLTLKDFENEEFLNQFCKAIETISTNNSIAASLRKQVTNANQLRLVIQNDKRAFNSFYMKSPQNIPLIDIAEFLQQYFPGTPKPSIAQIRDLIYFLFQNSTVDKDVLMDFVNGSYIYKLPLVYKRLGAIEGSYDQVRHAIQGYEFLSDHDFGTFCTLKVVGHDVNGGFYEFTQHDRKMILFAEAGKLIEPENKVLLSLFQELARLHNLYFFHGDLHFENIGYRIDKNGNVIIFFDLDRATLPSDEMKTPYLLVADLKIILFSLGPRVRALLIGGELTQEKRKYLKSCFNEYRQAIVNSGKYSRGVINEIDSELITFASQFDES